MKTALAAIAAISLATTSAAFAAAAPVKPATAMKTKAAPTKGKASKAKAKATTAKATPAIRKDAKAEGESVAIEMKEHQAWARRHHHKTAHQARLARKTASKAAANTTNKKTKG